MRNRESPTRFVGTETAPQWLGLHKANAPDDRQ